MLMAMVKAESRRVLKIDFFLWLSFKSYFTLYGYWFCMWRQVTAETIFWEKTMQPIVMATSALLPPLLPLSVGGLHHPGLIWIKLWFIFFTIPSQEHLKRRFELNSWHFFYTVQTDWCVCRVWRFFSEFKRRAYEHDLWHHKSSSNI